MSFTFDVSFEAFDLSFEIYTDTAVCDGWLFSTEDTIFEVTPIVGICLSRGPFTLVFLFMRVVEGLFINSKLT